MFSFIDAPEVTDIPKFYSVGCFKDNPNDRHLPVMLGNFRQKIDWYPLDFFAFSLNLRSHEMATASYFLMSILSIANCSSE